MSDSDSDEQQPLLECSVSETAKYLRGVPAARGLLRAIKATWQSVPYGKRRSAGAGRDAEESGEGSGESDGDDGGGRAKPKRAAERSSSDPKRDRLRRRQWKEQIALNLPIQYIACLELHQYMQENGCNVALFARRDCGILIKIWRLLYPDIPAVYLHCSRALFNEARRTHNRDYREYIRGVVSKAGGPRRCVFVDVHGTGQRMIRYFASEWQGAVPFCYLVSAGPASARKMPSESARHHRKGRLDALVCGVGGSPIEMLNYDLVGSASGFADGRVKREPLEYPKDLVSPAHDCAEEFVRQLAKYQDKAHLAPDLDHDKLREAAEWLMDKLRDRRRKPIISTVIEHVRNHERKKQEDEEEQQARKSGDATSSSGKDRQRKHRSRKSRKHTKKRRH